MIAVAVPGKLFVAGEYAVLEPGRGAVLVAVDRFVTAEVTRRDDLTAVGTVTSAATEGHTVTLVDGPAGVDVAERDRGHRAALRHVLAAVTVARRYATEIGCTTTPFDLTVRSELIDPGTGRKLGLGSSGAVTAAVIRALARHHGFEDGGDLLKLALLAGVSVDPSASGGDIAASMSGGWIEYRSPDRRWLSGRLRGGGVDALSRALWPGFAVRRLPAPRRLRLEVGWTGRPVSSQTRVAAQSARGRDAAHGRFVTRSDACVTALADALTRGDDTEVLRRVTEAATVLRDWDIRAGLGIETADLRRLRETATALGAAAKSSGAGGGDCGIALIEARRAEQLRRDWHAAGVHPLPVRVWHGDPPPEEDLWPGTTGRAVDPHDGECRCGCVVAAHSMGANAPHDKIGG